MTVMNVHTDELNYAFYLFVGKKNLGLRALQSNATWRPTVLVYGKEMIVELRYDSVQESAA